MKRYVRLTGDRMDGQIVVRIVDHGGTAKAFIIGVADPNDDADAQIFPSEEMAPHEAFRVVENKREAIGDAQVFVEMEVGVEWNPEWGTLVD